MKNPATLFLIIVFCIVLGLCLMKQLGFNVFPNPVSIPVAIAASDVRAVDELIGERVTIKFITGAGYGKRHEKVQGLILKRRGEFFVVKTAVIRGFKQKQEVVWCNLRNISTIWPEEDK